MLRITARKGGKAAAAYYLLDDAGRRAEGVWFGDLAEKMGLTGLVDHAKFAALCDNVDFRTGKKWTVRDGENRNALFDLTFLEPKSFTLLRHLTGDERLEQARREALFETAAFIERDANTQWTIGPLRGKATTGNIAAAAWFHETGRPAKEDGRSDPMGHCHLTILNGTEHNGRIRSLNFRFQSNEYYAAIHSSILAKKTAALGYGIVEKGKYWEVAGVSEGMIKKFSRRQEESEEYLAKANAKALTKIAEKRAAGEELSKAELHVESHGLTGKAVSQAGAASRSRKKHDTTLPELVDYWKSRLTEKEAGLLAGIREAAEGRSAHDLPKTHKLDLETHKLEPETHKHDDLPGERSIRKPEELAAKPEKLKVDYPALEVDKPARKAPAQRKDEILPRPAVAAAPTPAQPKLVVDNSARDAARDAVRLAWGEGVAKRKPEMSYRTLAASAMRRIYGRAEPADVLKAIDTCGLPRTEKNGFVIIGRKPVNLARRIAKWSGEKMRRMKYEAIRDSHAIEPPAIIHDQRMGMHL